MLINLNILRDIRDFISKRVRYGFHEFVFMLIYSLSCCIIGWGMIIPLSKFIPRKKNLIVFIGRDKGLFVDNVKYMFIEILRSQKLNKFNPVFITENKEQFRTLRNYKIKVFMYPSVHSILALLRCGMVVVDHDRWVFNFKFFWAYSAIKIQLWHGVGLKYVGLLKIDQEIQNPLFRQILLTIYRLIGLVCEYDLFISTSKFYTDKVFKPSFPAKCYVETGYPRNDIMFKSINIDSIVDKNLYLINADLDILKKIVYCSKADYKIILYAPTFRDSGGDPISDGSINLKSLNEFAKKNDFIFVFKFHPDPYFKYIFSEYSNVLWYEPSKDVYPLLPLVDLMITDYSAIFSDFILTNKPIIFYPYDIDKYISQDRPLQFDYYSFTPGPKCFYQDELVRTIEEILIKNNDLYATQREYFKKLAHNYQDGKSSKRIISSLQKYMLTMNKAG